MRRKKKTIEFIEIRQRNEERRQAEEADRARRLAERQEAELQHIRDRSNKQNAIAEKQAHIQQQRSAISSMVRQEREAGERLVQEERRLAQEQAHLRHERVRHAELAALHSRARSEESKKGLRQGALQERMAREGAQHRELMADVERMEREEAELIARLQRSQMRHQQAFAQLEDARRGDISLEMVRPRTGSTSSGMGSHQRSVGGTPSSSSARPPQLPGCVGTSGRPPMGARHSQHPASVGGLNSRSMLKSSSEPALLGYQGHAVVANGKHGGSAAASSCSTAFGTDHGEAVSIPGTPPGASEALGKSIITTDLPPAEPQRITYTTSDGAQLEIAAEEEFDLEAFLKS